MRLWTVEELGEALADAETIRRRFIDPGFGDAWWTSNERAELRTAWADILRAEIDQGFGSKIATLLGMVAGLNHAIQHLGVPARPALRVVPAEPAR